MSPFRIKSPQLYQLSYRPKYLGFWENTVPATSSARGFVPRVYPCRYVAERSPASPARASRRCTCGRDHTVADHQRLAEEACARWRASDLACRICNGTGSVPGLFHSMACPRCFRG